MKKKAPIIISLLLSLSCFLFFNKSESIDQIDYENENFATSKQPPLEGTDDLHSEFEEGIQIPLFENILTENDSQNLQTMNEMKRANLIKDVTDDIAKGKYQAAMDLIISEAKIYKMGQESALNDMLADLTMILNMQKNPESPLAINPDVYSRNDGGMFGNTYHVKDKYPITFHTLTTFKSPEVCALASLHFSYELLAFAVLDEGSYINFLTPDDGIEIVDFTPSLSDVEINFVERLKRRNADINEVYVYMLRNESRDIEFKAYLYRIHETSSIQLLGYYFKDFVAAHDEISTARHFKELFSANAEIRDIDFSLLD